MTGPNPNSIYPNPNIKQVVYIKNVITRPNIIVGDYTYYDDINGAEKFEEHVTHHYEFLGDKLIIGKFCAIAKGIEFIMNGANHRMNSVTTYPFNIMGGGWEKFAPSLDDLPLKGDTVIGNDVWIGQNVTVLPGVHVGDGAIIAANSVVAKDVPAYCIAGGNPCKVIRSRFNDELTKYLLKLKWWDWDSEKIFRNMESLCSGDLEKIKQIQDWYFKFNWYTIANTIFVKDVPAYCIAGGNPCKVIRSRFNDELTKYLLKLKWWDWDSEKIFRNMESLCSGDLEKIKQIKDWYFKFE